MSSDHQYRTVARGSGVALGDFRCHACAGTCSGDEVCEGDSIAFVRRGVFERRIGSQRSLGVANHAIFYPRGLVHRTSHPADGGDDCTVLHLERALLDEVSAAVLGGGAGALPLDARPAPSALHLAQWRALRRCESGPADPVEVHERLLSLAACAVRTLARGEAPAHSPARPDTRRSHRDMAHDAARLLASRVAERWTLDRLADEACTSPFHLARVFKRELGTPVHRWLLGLRLREAVSRLAAGADDLTALALDLGFSSRGHLSDALRAEFGAAPSSLRRELVRERESLN